MGEPLSDWEQDITDRLHALEAYVGIKSAADHAAAAAPLPGNEPNTAPDAPADPNAEPVAATDAAAAKADELGVDISTVEPTGAQGQVVVADVKAAAEEPAA